MSPDNTELLYARYPSLFDHRHEAGGYRGIECPDGWFAIVNGLCHQIVNHPQGHDLKVFQIKEKFGALRFYLDEGSLTNIEGLNEAYERAANASVGTCEKCGEPGELMKIHRVMKTLCPNHEVQFRENPRAYNGYE